MTKYKTVMLTSLGAGLEFFDFTVYALFAPFISQNFFPYQENSFIALMYTFSIFALGYLARPLGGVVFGHLGDKYGRKFPFTITIFLMAIATLGIGFLPTYSQIGALAPILLIVLRLLQGFSVGGEIPGSVVFIKEHYAQNRTGFAVGLIFMSMTLGNALATLMGSLLTQYLSSAAMLSWGWRVPFMCGFLIGIVSFILRKNTLETGDFLAAQKDKLLTSLPFRELIRNEKTSLLIGFSYTTGVAALVSFFLFLPTYLTDILHYDAADSYLSATLSFVLLGLLCPLFGWLSDLVGRRKIIFLGNLFFILISYFVFQQLTTFGNYMPWLFALCLALLGTSMNGCYALAIAELFPTALRYSGIGLCYNIGYALIGGFTPLVCTYLINATKNNISPYYYLAACCLFTLFGCILSKIMDSKPNAIKTS